MNTTPYLENGVTHTSRRSSGKLEQLIGQGHSSPSFERALLNTPEVERHRQHCTNFGIRIGRGDAIDTLAGTLEEPSSTSPQQVSNISSEHQQTSFEDFEEPRQNLKQKEADPSMGSPYGHLNHLDVSCQCGKTFTSTELQPSYMRTSEDSMRGSPSSMPYLKNSVGDSAPYSTSLQSTDRKRAYHL